MNDDRITPAQPKSYDRTVFVLGDGVAFGAGAEDRFTISSFLQEYINSRCAQKHTSSVWRVVNKGLWSSKMSDDYILTNKIQPNLKSGVVKEGDIIIWIQKKRYSITELDKISYRYLCETLSRYNITLLDLGYVMKLAEKKGAYIDGRLVNHRGYRSASGKIFFDFVKNFL